MKNMVKNKWIFWIIGLLVFANLVALVIFFAGSFHEAKQGSPKEFLATKLNFTEQQKRAYFNLAQEHHENAQKIREKIKESKDAFFDLLKESNVPDSTLKAAARKVSVNMEELDLYTFEHFKKVRALCNPEQKKQFDELIHQITGAVSDQSRPQNRPPMNPNEPPMRPEGPPMPHDQQPMPPNPPQ